MANEQARQVVVVTPTKSTGVAILLTILFGPVGMFYSTIAGAIVMILVSLVVAVLTLGLGLILKLAHLHHLGGDGRDSHNKKLVGGSRQY